MYVDELDTPFLTADLDVLERNIHNLAESCRKHGIALRVHTKSHKIPEIAHMQIAAGAIGIVCQKLGEAEVMCAAGLKDILIPYNIVGKPKLERLTRLARSCVLTVAVDSEETACGIAKQAQQDVCLVRILVEIDTGGRRTGVQSPQAVLALAQKITQLPGLHFQGIMTYPSRLEAGPILKESLVLLEEAGIPAPVVSGGGTGTEAMSRQIGLTETRIGSYVWEGMTRISGSHMLNPERCPLRMVCTVVSVPTSDRVIIDGGQKAFTSYPPNPYGYIVEYPEAKIYAMSVEHGHVDISACDHDFRVGEQLSVIPLHGGMTVNLQDELAGVRNEQVEVIWKVAGRGKVR